MHHLLFIDQSTKSASLPSFYPLSLDARCQVGRCLDQQRGLSKFVACAGAPALAERAHLQGKRAHTHIKHSPHACAHTHTNARACTHRHSHTHTHTETQAHRYRHHHHNHNTGTHRHTHTHTHTSNERTFPYVASLLACPQDEAVVYT